MQARQRQSHRFAHARRSDRDGPFLDFEQVPADARRVMIHDGDVPRLDVVRRRQYALSICAAGIFRFSVPRTRKVLAAASYPTSSLYLTVPSAK